MIERDMNDDLYCGWGEHLAVTDSLRELREQNDAWNKAILVRVTHTEPPRKEGNVSEARVFETGATRSPDAGRDDPEGYLSPIAIDRFCEYMTKHRKQSDGKLRDSDNWQKGMPMASYMKGLWRHMLHAWTRYRGYPVRDPLASADFEEDLCAALFNIQGALHETVKARLAQEAKK